MEHSTDQAAEYDSGHVTVFNMGIGEHQQSSHDDGRSVLEQYLDLLREFKADPNVTIESAHYEPGHATIFIHDPSEKVDIPDKQQQEEEWRQNVKLAEAGNTA